MSRDRLDKLWQTVYTDFFQRAIGNRVKRLIIGTRWSLADPIGRLEEYYADDPRAMFIREPVLDENDERVRELKEYCGMDSYAMTVVLEWLRQISG